MEFEPGELVVVEAKDFFLGKKLGYFYQVCKYHEESLEVMLMDPNASVRLICVHLDRGDSITKASTRQGST